MVKGGSGPRLPAEALVSLRVASEFVRQELESDEAAEFKVLGLIDHAHSTASQTL
jgi:hypothetical protein